MAYDKKPEGLLEIKVHKLDIYPSLTGLCAGFESGEWRCDAFSHHMMDWLPEFALSFSERENLRDHNAVELLRKAAKVVYSTEKYGKRGEFGELLLHILMRQVFNTLPAINKIYYKSSSNETVKGFDAVHVVANEEESSLELWLGEAKFYSNASGAIRDVVKELKEHTERDYLRDEFLLIKNKIDEKWPHFDKMQDLLSPNTSLDTIFDVVCIPVLITYDSRIVASYPENKLTYIEDFIDEVTKYYEVFKDKCETINLPKVLRIHLFVVPLEKKSELVKMLDERLKACQMI